MGTPKPSGIGSNVLGNQWFTVVWDDIAGGDFYESRHEGEEHINRLRTPESALLAIAYGNIRYTQIRNVAGGQPSGWVKVTLDDGGDIVDIDGGDPPPPPKPPAPPSGLHVRSMNIEAGEATVAWNDADDTDRWQVLLEGWHQWRTVQETSHTFTGLAAGETYGWRVRGINAAGTGAPTRDQFAFDDDTPPPPSSPHPPRNVRAHCIGPRSAKIEWDPNHDQVDGYRVELSDGGIRDLIGTLVEVTGLRPATDYITTVYAQRGGRFSDGSTCTFTTGTDEPQPDPPDPDAPPAPTGLYVNPLGGGQVRAAWDHATDAATWWLATVDDQVWKRVTRPEVTFAGVPAGAQRTVQVYALVDGTRGKPTVISRITTGDVVTARTPEGSGV